MDMWRIMRCKICGAILAVQAMLWLIRGTTYLLQAWIWSASALHGNKNPSLITHLNPWKRFLDGS
eukprot:9194720-Pyramimonas_sp.AAC.1